MFGSDVREGVLRLAREDTRWVSTGWDGGFTDADAAYNVTVPDGWDRRDIDAYAAERLDRAGFEDADVAGECVLLTGVDQRHARGARCGSVEVVVTAGVSNPAALPIPPAGGPLPDDSETAGGTVNVFVGTHRALDDAALANLVAVVAEAKAATLLDATGFPGTTTDAVVAATDPNGDPTQFSGSGTGVGAAARACVREAVRASLDARYRTEQPPASVEDAEHGVRTDVRADVFTPDD